MPEDQALIPNQQCAPARRLSLSDAHWHHDYLYHSRRCQPVEVEPESFRLELKSNLDIPYHVKEVLQILRVESDTASSPVYSAGMVSRAFPPRRSGN